jgi:hypothetical protein
MAHQALLVPVELEVVAMGALLAADLPVMLVLLEPLTPVAVAVAVETMMVLAAQAVQVS